MKALVRWSATIGLVGSTLLTTVMSHAPVLVGSTLMATVMSNAPAFALTEQQIKEKLDAVPVYLITNKQGLPLSRPLPEGQNGQKGGSVTGVYMSKTEAQSFIDQLRNVKNKDPKMAEIVKSLQVTPVPLGVIYQQLLETKDKPNRLLFAFKPVEKEVQGAMELLKKSGQEVKQFRSVPVFTVRFGPDKGYVPIQVGAQKQEIIPLFLSKQDAQGLLNQVKPKFPQADIQVVDVDGVIKVLKERNDSWLNQVVLVPSPESRDYIRTLPRNNASKNPTSPSPAAKPSSPSAPAPKR